MAAARRLPTLSAEDAKALAIRYQLASQHTSLVLVAERHGDAKSGEVPTTVAVPQMLAAGWGGMAVAAAPMSVSRNTMRSMADGADAMLARGRPRLEERSRGYFRKLADTGNVTASFAADLEKVRKPLLIAVANKLKAGGKLPATVKELEGLCLLPARLSAQLTREITRQGLSADVVIRAFLELLDRDEGAIAFPSLDAETKQQVRQARKALEKYFAQP
jgi:DNA-binding protein Fis